MLRLLCLGCMDGAVITSVKYAGKADDLSQQARALKKKELLQKIARKKAKKKENLRPDSLDAEGGVVGAGPLVVDQNVSRMADVVARQTNNGLAIPLADSAQEESGSGEVGAHAARVLDFGPAPGKSSRRKAEKSRDAAAPDTNAAAPDADKKKKHKQKRKRADVSSPEREAQEQSPRSSMERQASPSRKDGPVGPSTEAGNKPKKQRLPEADAGRGENNGAEAAAAEADADGAAQAGAPPATAGDRGTAFAAEQQLQAAKGAPQKGLKSAAAGAAAQGSAPETKMPGAPSLPPLLV